MKFLSVFFISHFLGALAANASITVIPLSNNDSIRTHIAVPFSTSATEGSYVLAEVKVRTNNSCRTLIDPYITTNFFLKCTQPGAVALEVVYMTNGVARATFYSGINVINISETGTIIADPDGDGPSEEWLLGQKLWSTSRGSYSSCEACHGSPGSKAHSISLNSLNTAYAGTRMSTQAIPLTEVEKQAVIKFVKSYK